MNAICFRFSVVVSWGEWDKSAKHNLSFTSLGAISSPVPARPVFLRVDGEVQVVASSLQKTASLAGSAKQFKTHQLREARLLNSCTRVQLNVLRPC
jgi:hypothetical protein